MKGADAPRDAVATADGRFYEWKGERFISVTNVLDHTISKPVLVPWASKVVAEYAQSHPGADIKEWKRQPKEVKEASAQRGTDIHAWCESYFLNPDLALNSMPQEYLDECIGFAECIQRLGIEPIAAEATVYSREHGYAGTNDLFGRLNGQPILADIKTGKSIYPEYGLQLAAYRYAEFLGLPNGAEVPVPTVVGAYCLHVDHARTRLIPMKVTYVEFQAFCDAARLAMWRIEHEKTIVGKEVR